ncbi:uncharacterized protein PHACADRAFT_125504 [Phanerochaete carnosa HHB-10118-sp]|uniref:F-box domain-containing protein n=1 Tax=Phanerochaete carnosa (strain HHB-10118-sp) TaxID=650164 RepID=K5UUF8_PHACS|nr:uncharacterized protein PHACADRAFT_125504 [Phanerochaete carnosa HHB-10118-sp]EKM53641.1 hypothetical protein PHACADRAFT_125504 [Phanerochaete carnosa HHB-10118-sp]
MPPSPSTIPADVVRCVVQFLLCRKDLYSCTLVNHIFCDVSIPVLYRTLDIRIPIVKRSESRIQVLHPFDTILQKPSYGKYVRKILQCARHFSTERLEALRLCHNLRSFSWTDNCSLGDTDTVFCVYLDILQDIGINELHVKVSSGISSCMWTRLMRFHGISSLGVTSSQLPASDLDAWSARVGSALTMLDFSISSEAARYPQCKSSTSLFLRHMIHLRSLRLDAPTSSIPDILCYLPHLTTLDVRYRTLGQTTMPLTQPLARLQHLTIHVIQDGGVGLGDWILALAPHHNSLHSLTIHNRAPQGNATVPPNFMQRLAQLHGHSLRQLFLYNLALGSDGVRVLFTAFGRLDALSFIPLVPNLVRRPESCSSRPQADHRTPFIASHIGRRAFRMQPEDAHDPIFPRHPVK